MNLSFVLYDSQAQFSDALAIQNSRSSGMTNFVESFQKIEEHLSRLKESAKPRKLIVFFMTDGQDTVNKPTQINYAKEHLQVNISKTISLSLFRLFQPFFNITEQNFGLWS